MDKVESPFPEDRPSLFRHHDFCPAWLQIRGSHDPLSWDSINLLLWLIEPRKPVHAPGFQFISKTPLRSGRGKRRVGRGGGPGAPLSRSTSHTSPCSPALVRLPWDTLCGPDRPGHGLWCSARPPASLLAEAGLLKNGKCSNECLLVLNIPRNLKYLQKSQEV